MTARKSTGAKAPGVPKASMRERTWPGGLPVDPARRQRAAERNTARADWTAEQFVAEIAEARANPSWQAHQRLAEILDGAGIDPILLQDPELTRFVHLMRELLADSHPGESLEQMLRPLKTLMSAADGAGGGRPKQADTDAEWRERYDAKKSRDRQQKTQRDICEDIAAEWEAEGHAKLHWTTIRDGIRRARKQEN